MVAVTLRGRREVLRLAGALLGTAAFGVDEAVAGHRDDVRSLALYAITTGERIAVDYRVEGVYQGDALAEVAHLLRDHRTGAEHPIDPVLLDHLAGVCMRLQTRAPIHVVSGYRSPGTNAARHRGHPDVAGHSYHVAGRAVDVYCPDRDLRAVRRAATEVAAGGVGYYPERGFVHLDSGPLRAW